VTLAGFVVGVVLTAGVLGWVTGGELDCLARPGTELDVAVPVAEVTGADFAFVPDEVGVELVPAPVEPGAPFRAAFAAGDDP
jgi:hypothetical protein